MNEFIQQFRKKIGIYLFSAFFILMIFGARLGAAIIIAILIYKAFKYLKIHNNNGMTKTINLDELGSAKKIKSLLAVLVIGGLLVWLFFASIVIVDAGEVGVYSLFGKVKDEELKSGFHLVIPLAKVTKMSVRTEEYTMSIAQGEGNKIGDDSIEALTKEGLKVFLDITVLYRLEENEASNVYKTVGLDYSEKVIRPEIRSEIREMVSQYTAKDIYSEKREEANMKIFDDLKEKLGGRGITVEDVLLRNVSLPADLAQSIQEKLQAEQEAQKYDFILDKEKKEKARKIIEAEGQRDSQKIITDSLSPNYLYYLYVKELKDREGTIYVPTNPSTGLPLFNNLGR